VFFHVQRISKMAKFFKTGNQMAWQPCFKPHLKPFPYKNFTKKAKNFSHLHLAAYALVTHLNKRISMKLSCKRM